MTDYIARLDALVSGTVSNDSAKFHEVWPALLDVVSWAAANAPEIECRQDEDCDHCMGVAALERLRASVGEGGE